MKPRFFGLLHLDDREKTAVNVVTRSFHEQRQIYVGNAVVLADSLRSQGIEFTLLTNDVAAVEEAMPGQASRLRVVAIECCTDVPPGTRFYSAHFKIDALRFIAQQGGGYGVLCDLDAVCVNGYPLAFENIVRAEIPVCYDISEQVIPVFGHDKIIEDLKTLHGLDGEGRWIGGEFIGGPPSFFRALLERIDRIYGNYVASLSKLHHVGDEAVTSAAAELLRRDGLYIADAGPIGLVARYWNTQVRHPQKPVCSYLRNSFILHLPADKKFLAELASGDGGTSAAEYGQIYLKHWRSPAQTSNRLARRSLSWLRSRS